MIDFTAGLKRSSPLDVVKSRRALSLIRPYAARFEGWNQRAAKASATALSRITSPEERAEQFNKLALLYEEVEQAYEEFEAAVAGEPPHSRIDDLRAAFLRLLQVLCRWRHD